MPMPCNFNEIYFPCKILEVWTVKWKIKVHLQFFLPQHWLFSRIFCSMYSICVWVFTYKSDVNTAAPADGFMFNFPVVKSPFSAGNFSQRPKMILQRKEKWDRCKVLCRIIEFSQHDSVSHWLMSPERRQFMALLILPQTKEALCQQKYCKGGDRLMANGYTASILIS